MRANIWVDANWINAATDAEIREAETRLGVTIPPRLKAQLKHQNGGHLAYYDWWEQAEGTDLAFVGDSTVDGINPVQDWELASDSDGSFGEEIAGRELLVCIAGHSEDQLCLDYRTNGPSAEPALAAFFVTATPPGRGRYEGVDRWVDAMIRLKQAQPPDSDL